jgi:hypothetical protein
MKKSMKIIFMVLAAIFVPFPFGVALAVFLGFKVPTAEDQINCSAATEIRTFVVEPEYTYGKDYIIENPKIRKLISRFSDRKETKTIEFFKQLCIHNRTFAEILNGCNKKLSINEETPEEEKLTIEEWLLLADLRDRVHDMYDEYLAEIRGGN